MQPIVKFVLTKSGISSNLHRDARNEPHSLAIIGIFDPIFIQDKGRIAYLIGHFWK